MTHPATQGQFVLGLGAQKAGTSWLHDYMQSDPSVNLGPVKEYHVLDALHVAECHYWRMRPRARFPALSRAAAYALAGGPRSTRPKWIRYRLQSSMESYVSFFSDLLRDENVKITGDLTPANGGLSASNLTDLRSRFKAQNIGVKAIFVMREPVDRLLSAIAMHRRNTNDHTVSVRRDLDFESDLARYYKSPEAVMRSNYAGTLQSIQASFAVEEVHITLFERLFTEEGHRALAEFLGTETRLDLLDKPSFSSDSPHARISDRLRAEIVATHEASYRAAQDALPHLDLSKYWPNSPTAQAREAPRETT